MKKSILNLPNAQKLSKNELKMVAGGSGRGELCSEEGQNGQIVVCYAPYRCTLHPSGYSYCS
ncbi:hypothetical protein [Flavobacterium sp. J27]|uniref:hypothetical protein n=1 Tax=Flavobacterium sp. J27 TaxID=2060419 RepID=UPI00103021BB|nr:hypothetical protein [Flavobacterium sp. J27]